MDRADLLCLLPLIVLAGTSVLIMLGVAIKRSHGVSAFLSAAGLIAAFTALEWSRPLLPRSVTPLLVFDHFSRFFMGLLFCTTLVVVLISWGYLKKRRINHDEYYMLLLLATLGSAVLVASRHFASFFLGLEILSISLYTLISYLRQRETSVEAGIKYLALAAASSAFLLFGMALLYAETGSMDFSSLAAAIRMETVKNLLVLAGEALLLVGIGFKLALVPFHMWTPDVYEGAPAPVAAFVATSSKGAMFALLLRLFSEQVIQHSAALFTLFSVVAIASMLIGNLLALLQSNVKRILAYSSIAHLGYFLVAFLAAGPSAVAAAVYYLSAYFVTTLAAFGVIALLSPEERDADSVEFYRGLAWRRPWLAGIFTAALLSLAGIPLTAGFVGKFYVIAAGVGSEVWVPVLTLVAGSTIGLFYYLRVIAVLYARETEQEQEHEALPAAALSIIGSAAVAAAALLLLWLGLYPSPFIRLLEATVLIR